MAGQRDHSPRLLQFAREMRREQTDAERKLWSLLRDRRLEGYKFRRQYPMAGYIVDFYCINARMVVELDGGQHSDPNAMEYDKKRTHAINDMGVRVIRFDDHDV